MMKHYFLFFLVVPVTIFSQFSENWNKSDFTSNPEWIGNTEKFEIEVPKNTLHLNAPAETSNAYLSTVSKAIDNAVWEFSVDLDFNPSSSNYVRVFICHNQPEVNESSEGYFVMIGNSADEVALYKIKEGKSTLIIDGRDKTLDNSSNSVAVRVERSETGEWSLFSDTDGNGYVKEGSVVDDEITESENFTLYCKYTSTRSNKIHFGQINVTGEYYIDQEKPKVIQHQIINSKNIELKFSEGLDVNSINKNQFKLTPGDLYPNDLTFSAGTIQLNFSESFPNTKSGELLVSGIKDLAQNVMNDTVLYYSHYNTERYDVVINEVMVDPTPELNGFGQEYIEFFNTTDYDISLKDWEVLVDNKSVVLPQYVLKSKKYVVIVDDEELDNLTDKDNALGVDDFPALPNSSGTIILKSNEQSVIDVFEYPIYKMESSFKNDGGWSLERISANNNENTINNWGYSVNSGGSTIGYENSIAGESQDEISPKILSVYWENDSTYRVNFSEPIDTSSISNINSLAVENKVVAELFFDKVFLNNLTFRLNSKIEEKEHLPILINEELVDFSGNKIPEETTWRIGKPEQLDTFDISLNEILFNPVSEGVDFIEIYNRSDKVLLLSDLFLAKMENDVMDKLHPASEFHQMIFPKDYFVITEDTFLLHKQHLNLKLFNTIENPIPSMNDDEGTIVLSKINGRVVDVFSYNKDIHFDLISKEEGVSLEKINYDYPTNNPNNWHSASTTSNYATPTFVNSQFKSAKSNEEIEWLWLEDKEFSPNGDGYKDYLQIKYELKGDNWMGTLKVYDKYGSPIKQLLSNGFLGSKGSIKWDGKNDANQIVNTGIYIIYSDFFKTTGERKQKKLVVVVNSNKGI